MSGHEPDDPRPGRRPGQDDDPATGRDDDAAPPTPRRRLRPSEEELHYGEANRRRAKEFARRSDSTTADRPGRRWARAPGPEPPAGPPEPDPPEPGPPGPDQAPTSREPPPSTPPPPGPDHAPTSREPPPSTPPPPGPGSQPPSRAAGRRRRGRGRRATTGAGDARRRYEPDQVTGEVAMPTDLFGATAESPGVAQQPLAPWMTGEHRALDLVEPPEQRGPAPAPPAPGPPPAPAAPPPRPPPATGELAVEPPPSARRGSVLVAAGIFLSRSSGLVREMVIGAVLGTSPAADAFKAALRIPNLMQNLLGEGVLSASFIPVYARLRAEDRHREAGHLAGAIAGLLAALTGAISVVGIVLAGPLTSLLVPGFTGAKHDLTVQLTRIMFPGIGFLVLSAWCLGVLNSHRRFFLSYVAPVLWNVAQIAALVAGVVVVGGFGTAADRRDLAVALSWGVLVGGVLQFGVQLAPVRRLLGGVRLSLDTAAESVRSVVGRFVPVVLGRGAIQLMGWVDLWLASYLVSGAIASLTFAMVLYLLPVSLFGVSVAAAELPDMSEVEVHDPDTRQRFRRRLEASMGRIAWYVAFTATMFIVVGDVIVAAVFERGSFTRGDTVLVWLTLAVLAAGLLPVTATRLLQNGLYALDDPRTPARLGVFGVVLSAAIGVVFMFPLDRLFVGPDGIEGWGDVLSFGPLPAAVRANVADVPHLGIVGLAIGASLSRWIEYRLLSNALAWRVGRTALAGRWLRHIAVGCAAAAIVAFLAQAVFAPVPAIVEAALVLGPAGATYLAVTHRLGVPEARATADRLLALYRRTGH